MRVTVTGGSGFFGRYVVHELIRAGHLVNAPSHLYADLTTVQGRYALIQPETDAVVHLAAAVGGIGANAAEPGRFFYENASMGIELMELARKRGIQKFVTIGTSCEYPALAPQPLRESSIWDGYPEHATARYGLAKRMLLEMGQAYREQYGFNVIHLLPTNLYGPGDNFNLGTGHVIPALIKKFGDAEPGDIVTCWGTGQATRDFIYVADAARAVRIALESYDDPTPVNIGAGIETSIADVAKMIAGITGFRGEIVWDARMPEGVQRRILDTSRARYDLGFRSEVKLLQGLRMTIDWYERQKQR